MAEERSDEYFVGRLVGKVRLLIATSDDIPIDVKLQTQPMLKEFERGVVVAEEEDDRDLVRGQYAFLCRELEPYADIEALLSALRNFVPWL
ncbi:MAG: hypothetical protein ACKOCT_03565 [Alphaproteobacteria bacterium]